MPNIGEHCTSCEEKYGVSGEDLHHWMDALVKVLGSGHRSSRHMINQIIPKKFIDKYGDDLAKYLMEDHILLDAETLMSVKTAPDAPVIKIIYRDKNTGESIKENEVPTEGLTLSPAQVAEARKILRELRESYTGDTKHSEPPLVPSTISPNRNLLLSKLHEVKKRLDRNDASTVAEAEYLLKEVDQFVLPRGVNPI